MKFSEHQKYVDKMRDRDTVLVLAFIMLGLNLWQGEVLYLKAQGLILLVGMIFPKIFKPLRILWFKLGEVLGTLSSKVILSLAYIFILSPVALMKKSYYQKRFALNLKNRKEAHYTSLIKEEVTYDEEHLRHPF